VQYLAEVSVQTCTFAPVETELFAATVLHCFHTNRCIDYYQQVHFPAADHHHNYHLRGFIRPIEMVIFHYQAFFMSKKEN
jgi:hypothetical protein